MADKNVLDFRMQAEQMLHIIESKLNSGQSDMATDLLVLKFKTLFEQGVASGKIWAEEGIYPFTPFSEPTDY
jgi:hypothetical protein